MSVRLESSWLQLLKEEFEKPYFKKLAQRVRQEIKTKTVYPPPKLIFNALNSLPFPHVRVVILGQDPYHEPNQAHGLAFSVPNGVALPPSLRNIYKEIENDLGTSPPRSGDLTRWVKQGVLLLNATLTVEAHKAASHQKWGWEDFTDAIISSLSKEKENLVFILWGSYARQKSSLIDQTKHLIITSAHPSPLSAHRGFFGSRPFSRTNSYLIAHKHSPINW